MTTPEPLAPALSLDLFPVRWDSLLAKFQELLLQVSAEHELQVRELRCEIARLGGVPCVDPPKTPDSASFGATSSLRSSSHTHAIVTPSLWGRSGSMGVHNGSNNGVKAFAARRTSDPAASMPLRALEDLGGGSSSFGGHSTSMARYAGHEMQDQYGGSHLEPHDWVINQCQHLPGLGSIIAGPRGETRDRKVHMIQQMKEKQHKKALKMKQLAEAVSEDAHEDENYLSEDSSGKTREQRVRFDQVVALDSPESSPSKVQRSGTNPFAQTVSLDSKKQKKGMMSAAMLRADSFKIGLPNVLSGKKVPALHRKATDEFLKKKQKEDSHQDLPRHLKSEVKVLQENVYEDEYDVIDPEHRTVKVEIKSCWVIDEDILRSTTQLQTKLAVVDFHTEEEDDMLETIEKRCEQLVVTHPSSKRRLMWDILGMIFLAADLVTIPLQAYGDHAKMDSTGWTTMALATSIYWTLDLLSSFFVGYHTKGHVEMTLSKIVRRYLRTWFILDLLLVSIDWTFISLGFTQQASFLRVVKTMSRGMRALRLLRIVRMHTQLTEMMDRIQSEYVRTMFSISALVFFIVIINHFIACGWYGIGRFVLEQRLFDKSWVSEYIRPTDPLGYRYFTSLHWSLTQFTPASMEVVPQNTLERVYSVCVLLFALITFSSFVSSITQAMTHLRSMNARKLEQQSVLRRYLGQHGISPQLVNRVWHYLHQRSVRFASKVRTKEVDVPLLDMLPMSMRVELRTESFTPELKRHPFFYRYNLEEPVAIRQICTHALTEISLLSRHELFTDHSHNVHMFFVLEGHLEYLLPCACAALDNAKKANNGASRFRSQIVEEEWEMEDLFDDQPDASSANNQVLNPFDVVSKGQWACEVALWIEQFQLCSPFVAVDKTELLLIDSKEFQQVASKHQPSLPHVINYAQSFTENLPKMTSCRWRVALCNDKDLLQEMVLRDFEVEDGPRTSEGGTDIQRIFGKFGRMGSMSLGRKSSRLSLVHSLRSSTISTGPQCVTRDRVGAKKDREENGFQSAASCDSRAEKSLASLEHVENVSND